MEFIILTVIFLSTLAFIYFYTDELNKAERQRFREFVIAVKSKDIVEYKEAIPEEGKLPVEEKKDEYVELDQVNASTLLKAITKE